MAARPSLPGTVVGGNWVPLGPKPIVESDFKASGRVTSLAVPNLGSTTVFAGTAGGGVWKSVNSGANWVALTDPQPTLAIGALAVDQSGQVIYAGTGEDNNCGDCQRGAGILKSTDGGTTWNLLQGISGAYIGELAVDSRTNGSTQHVYAATSNGLQASVDGGITWSPANLPNSGLDAEQVLQDPGNPTIFVAGRTSQCSNLTPPPPGAEIAVSTDGGQTWQTRFTTVSNKSSPKASRIAIALGKNGTGYAAISGCGGANNDDDRLLELLKTIDHGRTWAPIGKPYDYILAGQSKGQGYYDNVVAVDPINASNAVFGGIDLIATSDGGKTFTNIGRVYSGNVFSPSPIHPDQHAIAFFGNKGFYVGNDGGVWSTQNLGGNGNQSDWSDLNNTLAITQFYNGAALDISNFLGGAQDNGTSGHFPGAPGLPAWQSYLGGDGSHTAIDPTPGSNIIYGEGNYAAIFLGDRSSSSQSSSLRSPCSTADSSGSEPACNNPKQKRHEPSEFTGAPFVMDPTNPQRLLVATDHVYETTSGGTPPGTAGISICFPCGWSYDRDPTKVFTYGGSGADVTAMVMGPAGSTKTVFTGSSDGAVFMTTNDLGNSNTKWVDISNKGLTHVYGLAFNPSNSAEAWVVEGTDFEGTNVVHTTNAGAGGGLLTQWNDLNYTSDFPPPRSIALDPTNPATIYVSAQSQVLVCASCGGPNPQPSWAVLGSGLPNARVDSITVTQDHRNLIAWTHGRGAWEIPLPVPARAILPYLTNGSGAIVTAATVQNRGTAAAAISIQYFDTTGQPVGTDSNSSLPVNASWTVRQDNGNSFASGKEGSALIQSDQPVSAFVNEYLSLSDASSYTAISAATGTSQTLYAPEILNNGYGSHTSTVQVVNTGRAPTNVTLTYRDGSGNVVATYTIPGAIPPLGMSTVTSSTASLPNGFKGAATIQSSGQPLAALVSDTGQHGQFSSYSAIPTTGSTGPGNTLYFPGTMNTFDLFGNANVPLPPLTGINKIFASGDHALALRSDGTVWAWGANYNGQLGNGGGASNIPIGPCPCYNPASPMPVEVLGEGGVGYLTGVVAIGGGGSTSLAVTSDGSVWAWGYNFFGQLGNGNTTDSYTPVRVQKSGGGYLIGATAVVSGTSHSMALLSDGTVWAWGNGFEGELGNGAQNSSYQAQLVPGLGGVSAIATGGGHSLAVIQADGSVRAWGSNRSGELGIGSTTNALSPQPVLAPSGQAGNLTGIFSVAAGGYHSMALKSDGSAVYAWGSNGAGQLGVNSTTDSTVPEQVSAPAGQSGYLTNIRTIAANAYQSAASTTDLVSVYQWGSGSSGQSLVPKAVSALSQTIAVGMSGYPLALRGDGTAYSYGDFGNCGTSPTGTTPTLVVGQGCYHSSRLGVQNTTSAAGTVTVTYYDAAANATTTSFAIAANGSLAIDLSNPNQGPPVGYTPYATVLSSTVAIVATAVEVPVTQATNYLGDMSGTAYTSSAYNALNAGSATVYLPLVESLGSDGIGTAVEIMNTGAASTTATVTYYDAATGNQVGTPQNQTIPANAIATVYQVGGGLPAGSRATAVVTTSTGGQVVVICNELANGELMSYGGQ